MKRIHQSLPNRRLVVGISGATGIAHGIRNWEALHEAGIESHLVVTKATEMVRTYETALSAQDLRAGIFVKDSAG
jgi:4-hydroxy-3-polyprenylbenzoate decarboxylase